MGESIKYFTAKELKSLFKVIEGDTGRTSVRNEALFKLAYYCAMRVSEIGLWKKEDFNTQANHIYCHRIKGGENNTLKIIDDDVLRALKRYLRNPYPYPESDLLFPSMLGNAIDRNTLNWKMKEYCEKAKIKDQSKWHMHTLRHTRAIELAESGLDIKDLQYWLGHVDVSNTQIYFSYTSKQQENLYKKLRQKK